AAPPTPPGAAAAPFGPASSAPPGPPGREPTKVTCSQVTRTLLIFLPSCDSHRSCVRRPSTNTGRPFLRYSAETSAVRPHATQSMYETSSTRWPLCLFVYERLSASENSQTAAPCGVYRSSGSLVRFPSSITL